MNGIENISQKLRNDNVIKVYKIDIPENSSNLINSDDLFKHYQVDNAKFTDEYWYTGNLL